MVDTPTLEGFHDTHSDVPMRELAKLDAALAKARATMDDMLDAVEAAEAKGGYHSNYTVHEITGVGRYVTPREFGWTPLLNIIRDRAVDIDFSPHLYPYFDSVIAERFNGAQLSDPLDDEFEDYKNLRDNIAAVRNFLMQTYYSNPPHGMTAAKARQALEQIGEFVGEGLHNNLRLFGIIPNHNPTKPFISLSEANRGDGRGAQYLYEKILEMQRHNNWTRPFWAVTMLFGGKGPADWALPPESATPFHDNIGPLFASASTSLGGLPTAQQMQAVQAHIQELEQRRMQLQQSAQLTLMAFDLDAMGNHLLFAAQGLPEIAHLNEPVRREAVDIAREILRKLKLAIGNFSVIDGLKVKPEDDVAALGAIKGVTMVYERLLAWARGLDHTILQHPSVLAANRAVGQLGYLTKAEAYKIAKLAGNTALADKIKGQLDRVSSSYASFDDTKIGHLLEKIERGIDTVINRAHEVTGPNAMLGHNPAKDISSFMTNAPTAGQAMHLSSDASSNKAKHQAEILQAQDMAERAMAQQMQAQAAQRLAQQGQQQQPTNRGTGRQQMRQAQQQQRQSQSSASASTQTMQQTMNPAQRAALAQRQAWMAAQAKEQEEALQKPSQQVVQRIDPRLLQNIRSATNTNGLTTGTVPTSNAAYRQQQQQQAQRQQTQARQQQPAKGIHQVGANPQADKKQQQTTPLPVPPNRGGRSI